jgi:hypothetical protein
MIHVKPCRATVDSTVIVIAILALLALSTLCSGQVAIGNTLDDEGLDSDVARQFSGALKSLQLRDEENAALRLEIQRLRQQGLSHNNPSGLFHMLDSAAELPVSDVLRSATPNSSRREALIAFYNSTGGLNWIHQSGWLTSSDECTWSGITCNNDGVLIGINLSDNNLTGTLPYLLLSHHCRPLKALMCPTILSCTMHPLSLLSSHSIRWI